LPFRNDGVMLLGELAEAQPPHRKQIVPALMSFLKETVQLTNAEQEAVTLAALHEVELAGNALLRCGAEGKEALNKEALPRLKDLQFHKSEHVRNAAEQLQQKIMDAP
jgi:hypothetical protein